MTVDRKRLRRLAQTRSRTIRVNPSLRQARGPDLRGRVLDTQRAKRWISALGTLVQLSGWIGCTWSMLMVKFYYNTLGWMGKERNLTNNQTSPKITS